MSKYAYAPLERVGHFDTGLMRDEKSASSSYAEIPKPDKCTLVIHWLITSVCFLLTILLFPFVGWFAVKVIRDYERLVVFRLGILQRPRSAGVTFILPFIDICHRVDMRLRAFSVPPRQISLRNGAIVEIGCEVHFRIDNAVRCVLNVTDLNGSLRILAQTALVNRVCKLRLDELESGRSSAADLLVVDLNESACLWGVTVQRCEISQPKVIRVPSGQSSNTFNNMIFPPSFGFGAGAGASGASGTGNGNGGADVVSQLMQHFLPNLSQLIGGANQSTWANSQTTAAPNSDALLVDIAGVRHASIDTSTSGGVQPSQPTPSPLALKIDALIQVAQRALIEDASLRSHLNALYLFKIYSGNQLTGTPTLCYLLDAKATPAHERERLSPSDLKIDIDCSISLVEADLDALFDARLNTWQAFLQGRVHVDGDANAALRLTELAEKLKTKL